MNTNETKIENTNVVVLLNREMSLTQTQPH